MKKKRIKDPQVKYSLAEIDDYFYRDSEMARPTIDHDVKSEKEVQH